MEEGTGVFMLAMRAIVKGIPAANAVEIEKAIASAIAEVFEEERKRAGGMFDSPFFGDVCSMTIEVSRDQLQNGDVPLTKPLDSEVARMFEAIEKGGVDG